MNFIITNKNFSKNILNFIKYIINQSYNNIKKNDIND